MSTINLGDVSNKSIVLTVHKLPMQIGPEAMTGVYPEALNPDALAEIYSDTEQKQTAHFSVQSVSDETGFSSVSPNPRHKSEGFGDNNYRNLKFEQLEQR